MANMDEGLAFLLQFRNVAWYEDGRVRILDRRVYPRKVEYVTCTSHRQVAQALSDMVTQSLGPYMAAGMGMALAAHEARSMPEQRGWSHLLAAAQALHNARPTTALRMKEVTDACLAVAKTALDAGESAVQAVFEHTLAQANRRYAQAAAIAKHFVELLPGGPCTLLTQCFAESNVGFIFKEIASRGLPVKVICPETRPYLQGARLTASVAHDQGMDVTVVTDNMPAHLMQQGKVDVFTAAADAICMDGHVVNKVGTLQIAICAHRFGIPTLVTGNPDAVHPCAKDIEIELRDSREVLHTQGVPSTMQGVKGYYPAFDVTPPSLIGGVVTDKGVFSPYDLRSYFSVKKEK